MCASNVDSVRVCVCVVVVYVQTGQSEGEEADDTSDTVDKLLEAVVNASVNL